MCGDIPEKHSLVAAHTDEAVVVLRNAQVVHFVAMSAVFLYFEAGCGIEEADVSVGATGQELRRLLDVCRWLYRWCCRGTYVLA
jgi:NO-binding membrane sensor protein with MHYT domain